MTSNCLDCAILNPKFDGDTDKFWKDYTRGDYLEVVIDEHDRLQCNNCSKLYEGKIWIDDIYYGSPELYEEAKLQKVTLKKVGEY